MAGTKIVVLQMKEIIRTVAFVLVALVLIIFLVTMFVPKEKDAGSDDSTVYNAGTYSSAFLLGDKSIDIMVTVDDNSIIAIDIAPMEEVQTVFYPLVEPTFNSMAEEIIRTQSLNIQASVDTAVTSQMLLNAVATALDEASY